MPSLSLKASINYPIIGGSSSPSYDPDAQAWFTAVEATGNTISTANKNSFNTAFLALKSNGIWDLITQGCFFVGIDGANPLSGAFTPFKNTANATPVNSGFVTADYNKLTGIVQDGGVFIVGTKSINTSVKNRNTSSDDNPYIPLRDRHFLAFNSRNDITDALDFGSFYQAGITGRCFQFRLNGITPVGTNWVYNDNDFNNDSRFLYDALEISGKNGKGFFGITTNENTGGAYVFESDQLIMGGSPLFPGGTATTSISTSTILIGPTNSTGKKRIACYSLGFSMDASQDGTGLGMVSTYDTIINNLLSSLT